MAYTKLKSFFVKGIEIKVWKDGKIRLFEFTDFNGQDFEFFYGANGFGCEYGMLDDVTNIKEAREYLKKTIQIRYEEYLFDLEEQENEAYLIGDLESNYEVKEGVLKNGEFVYDEGSIKVDPISLSSKCNNYFVSFLNPHDIKKQIQSFGFGVTDYQVIRKWLRRNKRINNFDTVERETVINLMFGVRLSDAQKNKIQKVYYTKFQGNRNDESYMDLLINKGLNYPWSNIPSKEFEKQVFKIINNL